MERAVYPMGLADYGVRTTYVGIIRSGTPISFSVVSSVVSASVLAGRGEIGCVTGANIPSEHFLFISSEFDFAIDSMGLCVVPCLLDGNRLT